MNKEVFIEAIREVVERSSIEVTISNLLDVPGRSPNVDLIERSEWYRNLASKDQEMVCSVVKGAVENTIFGFLCVLDGVRAIEDGSEKGELQLSYRRGEKLVFLNDPSEEELHNLYNTN